VLPRTYDNQVCSIARTLEVMGDRWTALVIRDAFLGRRRFDEYQASLGCARNVLADRLARLVDDGILEKHIYNERPERYEYRLTAKGLDLWPVLMTLMKWGDTYAPTEGGPPVRIVHRDCGGEMTERLTCSLCGEPLEPRLVRAEPGPGAPVRA
jgi:DNA-binding HxlR family transcriptional regulator